MRDYTLYLKDILAAIESIEGFVEGINLETFQADDKTTSAVIRKLEIIGEATKRIPDETRQKHPHIPWIERNAAFWQRPPNPGVELTVLS